MRTSSTGWFIGAGLFGLIACTSSGASGTDTNNAPAEPTPETTDDGGTTPQDPPTLPPSPPQTGTDVTAAVATLDAALAAAVCERLTACCSGEDYEAFFGVYLDKPYTLKTVPKPAECAPALEAQLGVIHQKWSTSVAKGNMTFTSTAANACVDLVKTAACGVPLAKSLYSSGCLAIRGNTYFTKVAPPGASCKADFGDSTYNGECDPKQGYCSTDGVCTKWKVTGEDCTVFKPWAFCGPALDCLGGKPSIGGKPAEPGKCSSLPLERVVGESCETADDGTPVICGGGAVCDLFGTKKCIAKKPDGTACAYDDECINEYPYSCSPFGNGTCGQATYCSGKK